MMPVLSCLNKQLMCPNQENHIFVTFSSASSPITKSPNCFNCECGGMGLSIVFSVIRHPRPFHLCDLPSCVCTFTRVLPASWSQSEYRTSRPCVPSPGTKMGEGMGFSKWALSCEQERGALHRDSTSLTRISS